MLFKPDTTVRVKWKLTKYFLTIYAYVFCYNLITNVQSQKILKRIVKVTTVLLVQLMYGTLHIC